MCYINILVVLLYYSRGSQQKKIRREDDVNGARAKIKMKTKTKMNNDFLAQSGPKRVVSVPCRLIQASIELCV